MTDAKQKKVDAFLLAPNEDLKLLVTEEEQRELLGLQREALRKNEGTHL